MPVIRGRDHDRIDFFLVQEFSEVGEALCVAAHCFETFGQSAAMRFGEAKHRDIIKLAKRADVPLAHETIADEAEADAFVCANDARIAGGSEGRCGEKPATCGGHGYCPCQRIVMALSSLWVAASNA